MEDHIDPAKYSVEGTAERDGTAGRWSLIARNCMVGYGLFESEQEAWAHCDARHLRRENFTTVPIRDPVPAILDVEAFKAQLREKGD